MSSSLPSVSDLWSMDLPATVSKTPEQRFYNSVLTHLPPKYEDRISAPGDIWEPGLILFLGEAAWAPALRIACVIGTLEVMAEDSQFDSNARNLVDREKAALFWRILGQEVATDTKTSSGKGWTPEFIGKLPGQAARVMDDCHIWTYREAWDKAAVLFAESNKAEVQKLCDAFIASLESPLYLEQLRQKLTTGGLGIDGFQRLVYGLFVKAGLLERAATFDAANTEAAGMLDEESRASVSNHRDQHAVEEWANKDLPSSIPKTKSAIKALCEDLALPTTVGLDDSTRAQIRAIPQKMTAGIDGLQFGQCVKLMYRPVQVVVAGIQIPGVTPFLKKLFGEDEESKRWKGVDFLTEQSSAMQCSKN